MPAPVKKTHKEQVHIGREAPVVSREARRLKGRLRQQRRLESQRSRRGERRRRRY